MIGAVQRLHDFLKGEDYVDAVLLIQPVVFEGQAHTIQQYAIQHLGISGQIFELGVRKKALLESDRMKIVPPVRHKSNRIASHVLY